MQVLVLEAVSGGRFLQTGAASFLTLYFGGMKKKTSPCLSDAADFFVPLRA